MMMVLERFAACVASPARPHLAAWYSTRKRAGGSAARSRGGKRAARTSSVTPPHQHKPALQPTMPGASTVVVVGGGAAGFFAAIRCKELAGDAANVILLERGAAPLRKVKVYLRHSPSCYAVFSHLILFCFIFNRPQRTHAHTSV